MSDNEKTAPENGNGPVNERKRNNHKRKRRPANSAGHAARNESPDKKAARTGANPVDSVNPTNPVNQVDLVNPVDPKDPIGSGSQKPKSDRSGRGRTDRSGRSGGSSKTGGSDRTGRTDRNGRTGGNDRTGRTGGTGGRGENGGRGGSDRSSKTGGNERSGETGGRGGIGETGRSGGNGGSSRTGGNDRTGGRGETGGTDRNGRTGGRGENGGTGGTARTGETDRSGENGRTGGNRGKRPQIHDGFDDIRMNPRYVMVDEEPEEEPEAGPFSGRPGVTAGRNAVRELIRSGRPVDKIYVRSGNREGSVVVIVAEAVSRGIPIVETDQERLDRICGGGNHQGVAAVCAEKDYCTVDDILEIAGSRGEAPLIAVADGIEDPHNLGAFIRCAECAGAHGVIIPKRRAVGLTSAVAKSSAGAVEHIAVARVTNLAAALKELRDAGIWIFAAEAGGDAYYESDFTLPAAVVFGSEGRGISRIVKERADFTVSIPMYGKINSLNVSTAAAVILCHAARVRHT